MRAGTASSALVGKRILIVEDERLIALDVQDSLKEFGCDVIGPVGTVEEALELIEAESPDGAVIDVHLSNGTSEPVADELRARRRPFLIITAYQRNHLIGTLRDAPLLNKPIDERKLRETLSTLFDRTSAE